MSFKSSSKKQKQKKTFDDLVRVILTTAFREIDVNGDGTLDADELKAVGFSPAAIERFDKNGDGKLSQDEFCDSLFQVVTKKKTDSDEGNKIMSECITLVTRVLKDRHKRDAAALTAASSDQFQKYEELAALRADAAALASERDEAKSDAARLRLEAESLEAAAKASRAKIAQLMSQDLKAPAPNAAGPRAPATTAAAPSLACQASPPTSTMRKVSSARFSSSTTGWSPAVAPPRVANDVPTLPLRSSLKDQYWMKPSKLGSTFPLITPLPSATTSAQSRTSS